MNDSYEGEIRRITRTLSEIAHTLESADDPSARVKRVLELTRDLVPYRRCALLKALPSAESELYVLPEESAAGRARSAETLERVLRVLVHGEEIGRSKEALPSLTVPLMGLDQVIGLVRVEPGDQDVYHAGHLRLFSVVAAQLGAYLAMIRLREETAAKTRELAAAHGFQQVLLGVVGHDLRNPLSVMTMVATALLQETSDPAKAKLIERSLRSAQRAHRIINDLLDVTHSRANGEIPVLRRDIDLDSLVTEIVSDLCLANPNRDIRYTPRASGPVLGEWDPDRLAQVVTNLVNNALQHGDEHSPVTVSLASDDGAAVVSVENRGAGIPSELSASLFDPFRRGVDGRARRPGAAGLGLGLYIVDQIVRSHGGTVNVTSETNGKTVFEARLPRRPSPESNEPVRAGDTANPLVMVVDDDADIREGLTIILARRGYDAVPAANGAEALELLHRGLRPAMILLDLNMPVMDGEELWLACRDDPQLSSIPVLILSADAALAVKLTQAGASGFLEKPVHPDQLLDAIRRLSAP